MRGRVGDFDSGMADRDLQRREPNFYSLPFACQMIVWAIRKRLDILRGRRADRDEVLKVFHLASWGGLYGALLNTIDIFMRHRRDRDIALHAEHCPCLAPHEAYLINALTHLQDGDDDEALLCLCELMTPAGAKLVVTELRSIAKRLSEQNLRSAYIDLSSVRHHLMLSTLSSGSETRH